jgi:hypothetical protein
MLAPYGSIESYGTEKLSTQPRRGRQQMNMCPMFFCLLIPCGLFATVFYELSFSVHFKHPLVCFAVVVASLLVVCYVGYYTARLRISERKDLGHHERVPSWWCFFFLSMVFAWVLALALGLTNYLKNTKPYYEYQNLNMYYQVSPKLIKGEQVMDAGFIVFEPGSRLDTEKAANFKSRTTYCAAPIVAGNGTMLAYDFWAVGKNCCSRGANDRWRFDCGSKNPAANSGLRLMTDGDRPFYRLAVEQAEATYNITARHPVFFTWLHDAPSFIDALKNRGWYNYSLGVASHFLLQAFLVASATVAFSKLSRG